MRQACGTGRRSQDSGARPRSAHAYRNIASPDPGLTGASQPVDSHPITRSPLNGLCGNTPNESQYHRCRPPRTPAATPIAASSQRSQEACRSRVTFSTDAAARSGAVLKYSVNFGEGFAWRPDRQLATKLHAELQKHSCSVAKADQNIDLLHQAVAGQRSRADRDPWRTWRHCWSAALERRPERYLHVTRCAALRWGAVRG